MFKHLLCLHVLEENKDWINELFLALILCLFPSGDQKDVVRNAAQTLLSSLMEHTSSPQVMLEKMNNSFSHKNGKIREELLICLQNALNRYAFLLSDAVQIN